MKKLKQYAGKRLKNLSKHLHEYQAMPGKEKLHVVRVDLKKIKTLFHLFEFSSKRFSSKEKFKAFRKLFDEAGKVREYEVLRTLMKKHRASCLKEFESRERTRHIKEIKVFSEAICSFFSEFKKNRKKILDLAKKISAADKRKFYLKKEESLKRKIQKMNSQEAIHDVRKCLKELIYLAQFCKADERNTRQYKVLQKKTGDWLDMKILINAMKKYCKGIPANTFLEFEKKNSLALKKIKKNRDLIVHKTVHRK